MKLGCTYIKVSDMDQSIQFYESLTETKARYTNKNRWVDFACGIALYNIDFDLNHLKTDETIKNEENIRKHYNKAYINYVQKKALRDSQNIVFNFQTDDLIEERNRLIRLEIGPVSELMYVNVVMPYWFFIINDPDGNEIEITGPLLSSIDDYLGKDVTVIVDRPLGSKHPEFDMIYPINYGYIPNTFAGDGQAIDAYILDEFVPLESYHGKVVAVIHRKNDIENKLVVSNKDKPYKKSDIEKTTYFTEQYFDSDLILLEEDSSVIHTRRKDQSIRGFYEKINDLND